MKLMNEIESEYDGIVEEILVKNEETVEYGQPLSLIHISMMEISRVVSWCE